MTQEQLNEILKQHKLWFDSNFKEGTRLDLTGLKLKGFNFIDIDLRFARFAFVDLTDVDLSGAILRGADLFGATLRGANLTSADLRGANLEYVNLIGANLTSTILEHAYLAGANLEGTGVYFFRGPNQHAIYNSKDDKLYIGCQVHTLDYWLQNCVDIGKKYEYSDEEIEIYGNWFKSLKELPK